MKTAKLPQIACDSFFTFPRRLDISDEILQGHARSVTTPLQVHVSGAHISIGDTARHAAAATAFQALHDHYEATKHQPGLSDHSILSGLDAEAREQLAESFQRSVPDQVCLESALCCLQRIWVSCCSSMCQEALDVLPANQP